MKHRETLPLTDEQLTELRKRLDAADEEWATTQRDGPARELLAFHAEEYMRRLIDTIDALKEAASGIEY